MTDEFASPRERMEAYPTMADYCRSRDRDGLAQLISNDQHRKNVFGTYPGTIGEHALEVIAAASELATPEPKLRVTGFRGNPLRVVLSSGGEATISQKLIDRFASPSPFEQHPDDIAVDRFAAAMKAKLAKKRAEGAGGWDDPDQCHIDYLVDLPVTQIHERAVLDPIDIANIAMMIHERGETPSHGR